MRYLPTSKLTPGMALGQDIYDGAGRLLLAKHLLLSEEYISNLEFLGFPGIYIDDEFTQGIEIQQVLNPQVRSQALKVVHDMFAFDAASDAEEDMPVSEINIQKTIERIGHEADDLMAKAADFLKQRAERSERESLMNFPKDGKGIGPTTGV